MNVWAKFIKANTPGWSSVVPGEEAEAAREIVQRIAREDLLNGVLDWISHPEYVFVWSERDGENFHLSSTYNGRIYYDALVHIVGEELEYLKPWGEFRKP